MQKILLTTILFLTLLTLSAAPQMTVSSSVAADDVTLSWNAVEGAVYYDIYNGQDFLERLDASSLTYTARLGQNEKFSLVVGARDAVNSTLAAGRADGTTGSYEGVYSWINPTDDDNHGKVKSLVMRAELAYSKSYGTYLKIFSVSEDGSEELFFPLFDLESTSWPWITYDSDEEVAAVYRNTAARFNTSAIKPSRFRLERIQLGRNSASVDIRTRAFGIEVVTTTVFSFGHDEEGLYLEYSTTGTGIAKTAIFRNPVGGDDPYTFVLRPEAK